MSSTRPPSLGSLELSDHKESVSELSHLVPQCFGASSSAPQMLYNFTVVATGLVVDSRVLGTQSTTCDKGSKMFVCFTEVNLKYPGLVREATMGLIWRSCYGRCHLPSLHFMEPPYISGKSVEVIECHCLDPLLFDGAYQGCHFEMASNDGHSSFQIDVRLRLCHQFEPIKSQNSESQPYLNLASLSILKVNSTPRPTGIFAPATDHYKVLKVETRSLFARLTSNNSSFSNLNEIGLFTNVNLNKSYPGMRVVLFRASYSQTIGEPDGARRVILPDKPKIFNPRLHSHQQSYRTWAADEKNSAKPDPWQTTTLPGSRETYTQAFRMFTGGYYHALFFRENGYAGIISDIQYMCVILFPES